MSRLKPRVSAPTCENDMTETCHVSALVTLTSQDRRLQLLLDDHGWRTTKKVVAVVLGQPATIFVAQRQ